MTGATVRQFGDSPDQSDEGTADVLDRVRAAAADLLAALDAPPRSLRVRAGDVEIEVDWPKPQVVTVAAAPAPVPAAPVAAAAPASAEPPLPAGHAQVTAQTVGVFYRSPKPGADPFVGVGDVVRPGQQVAIIESMKLMIPVEADKAGRVVEVLVEDGSPVEFGQPLLTVDRNTE